MSVSSVFKGVVAAFIADAKKFKSAVLTAAQVADKALVVVQKDAPEVEQLVNLAFPQYAPIEAAALVAFEAVAGAVHDAGDAAAANGVSVTLDQQLIADIQKLLPTLKALKQ